MESNGLWMVGFEVVGCGGGIVGLLLYIGIKDEILFFFNLLNFIELLNCWIGWEGIWDEGGKDKL